MNAIQKLRKAMRRNRQQFGMFFGVSRETVRAWENGRVVPPEMVRAFRGHCTAGGGDQGGKGMNTIQKLRRAMRRNRHQFGMFFGVTREAVRAWETGRVVPPEVVREFMEVGV